MRSSDSFVKVSVWSVSVREEMTKHPSSCSHRANICSKYAGSFFSEKNPQTQGFTLSANEQSALPCIFVHESSPVKEKKKKDYWRHWIKNKNQCVERGLIHSQRYLALTKSSNPRWPSGSCLHPSSWPLFNVLAKVADIRNTMPSSCFVCRYVIEISRVVVGSCYA